VSAPDGAALREALREVFDPELGYNIVDLGLVYDIAVRDGSARVTMTLTTPGCPASEMIQGGVQQRLQALPGIDEVEIDLVWEPRWSPQAMSPVAKEHFGIED